MIATRVLTSVSPSSAADGIDSATAAGATLNPGQIAIQELVARAQAGDQHAFTHVYDLYAPKIQKYLRYHLNGRPEAAEDLASDVFLKALEKLQTYQFNGVPFSAWLYRIAHNKLIDYLRGQPKKQGVSLDECVEVDDPASERALSQTLNQEELADALDRLTDDQRQVISYRFLQDRSIADTARLMGKNEDAVKQLQVRAIKNMRATLAS